MPMSQKQEIAAAGQNGGVQRRFHLDFFSM